MRIHLLTIFLLPILFLQSCGLFNGNALTAEEMEQIYKLRMKAENAVKTEALIIADLIERARTGELTVGEAVSKIIKVKEDTAKIVKEVDTKISEIKENAKKRGVDIVTFIVSVLLSAVGVRSPGFKGILKWIWEKLTRRKKPQVGVPNP